MKQLLVLTRSLSVTEGQGRYSVEMLKQLSSDFQITVFTSERPRSDEHDLDGLKLKIYDLPAIEKLTKPLIYLRQTLKILPYFLKADLVHFFSDYPYCTFFSFIPAKFKKRFITVHGTYGVAPLDNKRSRGLLIKSFKVAYKVICVSNFTKQQITKRIELNNLEVISNGINLDEFTSQGQLVDRHGQEDFPIVLSVGNLKHRKGYHVTIAAMAKVKKEIPDVKYFIVASKPDADYFNQLEELTAKHGLEQTVIFLQNLSDNELKDFYQKCNLFLLTPIVVSKNKFEGFGLVYLEASAYGKPVIGTKGCGAEDAIRDGYSGLLVEQENIDQTAQAIIKILKDKDFSQELGVNGKKWVRQFDWSEVIEKYKKVYG
ncbi:MAG: hypothetical protein CMI53_03355 [Parcubacteria group bacterium]|nr:hypothetical protein [Parcubacteria group bacterium]|tara:strand:+ start:3160 stop:4278 length:1119 start_codon:yes stop_codon:yes gene_type:complete